MTTTGPQYSYAALNDLGCMKPVTHYMFLHGSLGYFLNAYLGL